MLRSHLCSVKTTFRPATPCSASSKRTMWRCCTPMDDGRQQRSGSGPEIGQVQRRTCAQSPEQRLRIDRLLEGLDAGKTPEQRRRLRAVRLLEEMGIAGNAEAR